MKVKDLKEAIKDLGDDVIVYIVADHGQMPEQANGVDTTADEELPYSSEDIDWEEESLPCDVTAILIG